MTYAFPVVILVAGMVSVMLLLSRQLRQRALFRECFARPFPAEWRRWLEDGLPPYRCLGDAQRERLHGFINVFIAEKRFEGCGGLELTEKMKVLIAGQACMLLLNPADKCYPALTTILVYPSTYVAGGKGIMGGREESRSVRLGESWQSGIVVLAWDSVLNGARNFEDGQNVTLHEFAHKLDQEDGNADGAPVLPAAAAYRTWAEVFNREYRAHLSRVRKFRRSVMSRYGATNPAEFFAVATEAFFEKPVQMKKRHPDLYEELRCYYDLDPVSWLS